MELSLRADQAQVLDRRHLRQLKYGNLHQGQAHSVTHPGCAKELGPFLLLQVFPCCDMQTAPSERNYAAMLARRVFIVGVIASAVIVVCALCRGALMARQRSSDLLALLEDLAHPGCDLGVFGLLQHGLHRPGLRRHEASFGDLIHSYTHTYIIYFSVYTYTHKYIYIYICIHIDDRGVVIILYAGNTRISSHKQDCPSETFDLGEPRLECSSFRGSKP